MRNLIPCLFTISLLACGGSGFDNEGNISLDDDAEANNASANNADGPVGNANPNSGTNNVFIPEEEQFLVRNVAATERFVFVPNSAEEGTTVARINGLDLSVTPIPVGLRPTDVVAFESDVAGAVAFVLVEGTDSVAIIRAEAQADDPIDLVTLLSVPSEVNALAASPDGRHVFAYIDPNRPFDDDSSVSSLQAGALLRLGATADDDESFELSLTRLIRDVEFTEDGSELFIVGREGVNRLVPGEVTQNQFVPPLPLDLSNDVFPPTDLEVEVAGDGSFLVVRSSAFEGVSLHPVQDGMLGESILVELPGIPTDIDLYTAGEARTVLATVRGDSSLALIDVDAAIDAAATEAPYVAETVSVSGANPGLAQITPDQTSALLYSTLPLLPSMGVYDFADETVRTYPLRNKISSVAISPDSETAVVVHERQTDIEDASFFQQNEGLTIFDIATGYRRPLTLQATPVDTIMTTTEGGDSYVFVLLESPSNERQGVVRVDLQNYRSDFIPLARKPEQIGLVAGKIFVSQEADDGRITFVDVETLTQRTVSGYELNAGID